MAWQTPIYDRTEVDIIENTEKAYIDIKFLNRVEGNTEYLSSILPSVGGYLPNPTTTKYPWNMTYYPDYEQFNKIIGNINKLKDSFPTLQYSLVSIPLQELKDIPTFILLNLMEKYQEEVKEIIQKTIDSYFDMAGELMAGSMEATIDTPQIWMEGGYI